MFRLAHISDVHLGPLPALTFLELFSKRITGFVNWHRNRRRHLFTNTLDEHNAAVAELRAWCAASPENQKKCTG